MLPPQTVYDSCPSTPVSIIATDAPVLDLLSLLPLLTLTNSSTPSWNHTTANSTTTSSTDTFTLSKFMASLSSAGRLGPQPTNISGIELQTQNHASLSGRDNPQTYLLRILSILLVLWLQSRRSEFGFL